MAVYKDQKRGTWYFRTRDRFKKEITRRGFKTKREAAISEAKFLDSNNVDYVNLSFDELEQHHRIEYIKRVKPKTLKKYDDIVRLHLTPFFSKIKIKQLHQRDIFDWKEEMVLKKLSKEHTQKCYTVLVMILNHGMKYFDLVNNVAKTAGQFHMPDDKKIMQWWEEDEFIAFISHFDLENTTDFKYLTLFNLLFYTGMRIGEALALTWDDIDLKQNEISISKSSSSRIVSTPKTKASIRTISITNNVIKLLVKLKAQQQNIYSFSNAFYVFGDQLPLHNNTLDFHWRKKLYASNLKRIRIHDFRHSHATFLFRHGFSILYISKRLGHKNITTTQEIYLHLSQELENSENELLEILLK